MIALKGKGKAAIKIGMQYRKLITDLKFYKPTKWKRKTSFSAIASAVRESAVCLHRSLQHKGVWMSFLMGLISRLTGA